MLRRSFTIFVLVGLSISGCAAPAHYVSRESTGGIVAIDNNTNTWPSYNRKRAEELMTAHFPGGYEIIREGEVVVDKDPVTTTSTTSPQNRTEWRIYYRPKTFTTSTLPQEGKSVIPASNVNTEGGVSPETFPNENATFNDPRAPKRTKQQSQMNPFMKNPDMLPNGGRATKPTLNMGN